MADDFPKLPFRYHQARADPALNLIPVAPSLHVPTDRLHDRESRFHPPPAAPRPPPSPPPPPLPNGPRLPQPPLQTTCRTPTDIPDLPLHAITRPLPLALL